MNKNSKQILISVILVVGGFLAVFALSDYLEKIRAALPEAAEEEDLALQGAKLKGFALGSEGLLADWYWMKSLQYIGDKLVKSQKGISMDSMQDLNPRLLYPYLDNATDLDPQFTSVFEYGAMVLPAIDETQAIKLLEKGIEKNPNSWQLYHYLGYIYWRLKDYEKASDAYARGARIQDAPSFMTLMQAKTKTEGGSRTTAREIYQRIFDEAQDEQTKENAALRLSTLDFLDERDIIQKTLNAHKLKNNRCANSWRDILPLLQSEKLPSGKDFSVDNAFNLVDPSGAAYVLDKENCEVKLDGAKTKILPE
jgi:tetratricopeptide (TPR) repeat protein